jgi:hypothetical protein
MPNTILHKRGTTEPTAGVLTTGELAINTGDGNVYTKLGDGTVSLIGGKSSRVEIPVRNETGSLIPAGSVVYISGASNGKPLITLSQANSEATSSKTLGLTTTAISSGNNGFVVMFGSLEKIDTQAYAAGQALWLSPSVAGGLTTIAPSAPNHAVFIGVVISSASNGKIEVRVANGYELQELHNVSIGATPADNDFLGYDLASGLWKNQTATEMGIPSAATSAEARTSNSTTKFLSPNTAHWMLMSPNIIEIQRAGFTITNTGTISFTQQGWISSYTRTGTAGACSSRWRTFGLSQVDQTWSMTDKSSPSSFFDFSNASWCSGRSVLIGLTESVFSWGFYHGKAESDGVGVLVRRGYGWRATGGTAPRYLTLEVHNGTTLTSVTSTYALTDGIAFDWDLISNGSGTVTLYVNGVQVATTTGGPTGQTNVTTVVWQEEVATSAASTGLYNGMVHSRGKFIAFDP